jgi:AraC-like DNA-binding protein
VPEKIGKTKILVLRIWGNSLQKTVFSSRELPELLEEKAKFKLWQEIRDNQIGAVEYGVGDDMPFQVDIETMLVGKLALAQISGTIKTANRTARHIVKDGLYAHRHLLLVNLGNEAIDGVQIGREYSLARGEAALISASEPFAVMGGDTTMWSSLTVPSDVLEAAFCNIDDKLAIPIAADKEALKLLAGYSRMLESSDRLVSADLIAHVTTTLEDLVGLVVGAKGEAADLAGMRGLKAVRLEAILARIGRDFDNPSISAQGVARALGLSASYVHRLLQESGTSFSDRVLELRLQKACKILSHRQSDGMRISEIAMMSGFGDVSYFNRSFRSRFGCSPGKLR